MLRGPGVLCLLSGAVALAGCRDLSGFSTNGGSFTGPVVSASVVLAGIDPSTSLCLTLDTDHLQDTPGSVWTSDGRFTAAPFRPIPQIWQDPLSTFTFGEGRLKNLLYVATASTPFDDGNGNDVFFVVSLMQAGDVEVRMLRGAPALATAIDASPPPTGNIFAVFDTNRQSSSCSF
jgi:hypothetical protein